MNTNRVEGKVRKGSLLGFLLDATANKKDDMGYLRCVYSDGKGKLYASDGRRLHCITVAEEVPEGTYLPESSKNALFLTDTSLDFPNIKRIFRDDMKMACRFDATTPATVVAAKILVAIIKEFGQVKDLCVLDGKFIKPLLDMGVKWEASFSTPTGVCHFYTDLAEAWIMPIRLNNED